MTRPTPRHSSTSSLFAALILAQAAHSIEEYQFRLYDVLAPARAVSDAFGVERSLGFTIANALLVGFGLWCFFARVRPARGAWRGLSWAWVILQMANGLGHVLLALSVGGYFPGLVTAPFLMVIAALIGLRLRAR